MSTAGDTYVFKRDHRSSIRLNYLHGLVKSLTGGLLHPSIPRLPESARVADIGTGTAIWPIELVAEVPASVRIDGFDISSAQFPNPAYRPPNLHLHLQDCFKPFPPAFHKRFDLVVIRFVVILVNRSNLRTLIDNLTTLLKPGGYIQWTEPDNSFAHPYVADPNRAHPMASAVSELIRKPSPDCETEWVHELAGQLEAAGFTAIERTDHPVPLRLKPLFNQVHLMSFEDAQARNMASKRDLGESQGSVAQLTNEYDAGVIIDWKFLTVVGRRP